jgi:hypothetical protein
MNIGAHRRARKIRMTEKRNVLAYRISQEDYIDRIFTRGVTLLYFTNLYFINDMTKVKLPSVT